MKYQLFLFDLDDTLLDFRASEKLSFVRTMQQLGLQEVPEALFSRYQVINTALWRSFELGTVAKDVLKVQRFSQTFEEVGLALDAQAASGLYLESLSETAVLIDGALQLCASLSAHAEVGIITNGVEAIQNRRIASTGLAPYISFVATSEACGHAKPDVRFFEYAVKMARPVAKEQMVIIGDRLDADILGANRYGIDSCWFNPDGLVNGTQAVPTCEVTRLHDVIAALDAMPVA